MWTARATCTRDDSWPALPWPCSFFTGKRNPPRNAGGYSPQSKPQRPDTAPQSPDHSTQTPLCSERRQATGEWMRAKMPPPAIRCRSGLLAIIVTLGMCVKLPNVGLCIRRSDVDRWFEKRTETARGRRATTSVSGRSSASAPERIRRRPHIQSDGSSQGTRSARHTSPMRWPIQEQHREPTVTSTEVVYG